MSEVNMFCGSIYEMLKQKRESHYIDPATRQSRAKVIPAIRDHAFLKAAARTTNRAYDFVQFKTMQAIFMDSNIGPILSYELAAQDVFSSGLTETKQGMAFCLDEFLINATDDEMSQAYEIFRNIKRQYIRLLTDVLTGEGAYGDAMAQHPNSDYNISFLQIGMLAAERIV